MASSTANPHVRQLRADGEAAAAGAAQLFEDVTAEQAATVTEIGWTVAATAAHLAGAAGFTALQLKQFKRGKAPTVPNFVVDMTNLFSTRKNRATPIAQSVVKMRETTATNLATLDDWTDSELETRFKKPYFGATTYDEALRYSFVGHIEEHIGQVRRALKI